MHQTHLNNNILTSPTPQYDFTTCQCTLSREPSPFAACSFHLFLLMAKQSAHGVLRTYLPLTKTKKPTGQIFDIFYLVYSLENEFMKQSHTCTSSTLVNKCLPCELICFC